MGYMPQNTIPAVAERFKELAGFDSVTYNPINNEYVIVDKNKNEQRISGYAFHSGLAEDNLGLPETYSARDLIRENNQLRDEVNACHKTIDYLRSELFNLQDEQKRLNPQDENQTTHFIGTIDSTVNEFKKFY